MLAFSVDDDMKGFIWRISTDTGKFQWYGVYLRGNTEKV